jgi:hypothetical protein
MGATSLHTVPGGPTRPGSLGKVGKSPAEVRLLFITLLIRFSSYIYSLFTFTYPS